MKGHGYALRQIAAELNAAGYRTRRGRDFHVTTVSRLFTRTVSASISPIVLEDEGDQRLESVSGSS
ncbi:MAG: recombinase family protein [Janthinobacterium lividum]